MTTKAWLCIFLAFAVGVAFGYMLEDARFWANEILRWIVPDSGMPPPPPPAYPC